MTKNNFITLQSWNTALYMYGNGDKPMNESSHINIFEKIKEYLNEENRIAVLQEIPYKTYTDVPNYHKKYGLHHSWIAFKNEFCEDEYDIIMNPYNPDKKKDTVIKQTVIVAKKGLINKIELKREDGNLFIPFNVTLGEQENKKTFCILGVHAHDACELREWLECRKDKIKPDIMIGDFNSGNYIKDKEDCKIAINR